MSTKRELTSEEAQAAFDAAPEVPLSEKRIQEIVNHAVGKTSEPATHEEARWFHEGFLSGATCYAAAVGHSTLKRDNEKLREVFDAQGWKTIETFEKLAGRCEHGVKDGDWCEPCNKAVKEARVEYFSGNPMVCACCGEESTNPGQFVKDGRWVCTESCRKNLPNVDSYDDLRESGGIVDAP